jgi:hypothetical protein
MKGHGSDHKKIAEALRRAAKAHEDAAKHMKKQGYKDREHEMEGMKVKKKSAAQKKALKGKSAAKKREIIGGEKANVLERRRRAAKKHGKKVI